MPPRLSIIVPVLNEAALIGATLRALESSRAAGAELIVVDGGSSDGTPGLCTGDADLVLAAPAGRATQMNAGAAAARSDRLLFLHADTRLPATAVDLVSAALADGNRCWGRFDVEIVGASPLFPVIGTLMNWRSRLSGIATGDQAMFMRRSAFEQAGRFPEQPLMEDIELSRHLKRLGHPACLTARVRTSGRRWERDGVWHTILLMWRLRLLYRLGTPASTLARHYR